MLKGLRFRERLTLLPGREKNAADAAPGPGQIGRARPLPKHRSLWIGVATLVVGLAFAGWQHRAGIAGWFAPEAAREVLAAAPAPARAPPAPATVAEDTPAPKPPTIAEQRAVLLKPGGIIHVRRAGSVLRAAQKPSAKALRKLDKGAAVTVVALDGAWTQVKDGNTVGWMRTSVLGPPP